MDKRTAFAVLAGLAMTLGLASCSCDKQSESDDTKGKTNPAAEDGRKTQPPGPSSDAVSGYPTAGNGATAGSPGWKTDWDAFVTELKSHFGRGAPAEEIGAAFQGQAVCWTGVVEEVDPDPRFAKVRISMSHRAVKLPGGGSATVSEVLLIPGPANLADWLKVRPGTEVRFRTTLRGTGAFPAVRLIPDPAGNPTVDISTDDAELVEVVRRGIR